MCGRKLAFSLRAGRFRNCGIARWGTLPYFYIHSIPQPCPKRKAAIFTGGLQKALQNAKKEKEDAEKRKEIEDGIADIKNEMASLSADDSLWAKKRMYELQKALEEKEKQLKDLEEQSEYEKKLAELEEKKQALQEDANKKIDALNKVLEQTKDGFTNAVEQLSGDMGRIMDSFVINLSSLLTYGTTTSVPNYSRSTNTYSSNTFNVNINAGNNSSGSQLANDFITSLQARGYKI